MLVHSISIPLILLIILVMGEAVGKNYDSRLTIPQEITVLDNGEQTLFRESLLTQPQLIIFANRDSFDVVEQIAEVFTYPENTVWVPNIALAPKWVVRAFIKPSLKKIAKRYRGQGIQMVYDLDGQWSDGLKITSEEDGFIAVFYADREGVVKVMEKVISTKAYKSDEAKISLGEEIAGNWMAVGAP